MNDIEKNIDLICNLLTTTYNSNILEFTPTIVQEIFLKYSEKYQNTNKGNTTLLKLIYNYYNPTKPIVEYISGPRTLFQAWSQKHNKMIYVFGETHSLNNPCTSYSHIQTDKIKDPETGIYYPTTSIEGKELQMQGYFPVLQIEDYLKRLSVTTDTFFDLYVESGAFTKEEHKHTSMYTIGNIEKIFKTCIFPKTRSDKSCDLFRIHYTDIRSIDKLGTNDIKKLKKLIKNNKELNKDLHVFKKLTGTNTEIIEYVKEQYNVPIVNKELKRSYMGEEIYNFFWKQVVKKIKLTGYKLREYSNKILNEKNPQIRKQYANSLYYKYLIPINSYLMDMYLISRIYKKFDIKKSDNQPDEARNIIMYVGDSHAQIYKEFFYSLNYEILYDIEALSVIGNEKKISSCLDMKDFPQPFFQAIPK